MFWEQPVHYASISDIGFRRQNNQDAFVVQMCRERESWKGHGHVFIIADGMGGHAVGELASKIAVDTIPLTYFKTNGQDFGPALKTAIETANAAIHDRGKQNIEFLRMGTTCASLVLSPRGAFVGHVGDSRVYRIRNNRIGQLTFDHSLQWEQLRQKKLKPEELHLLGARHVITRSLGPEASVRVDVSGPYPVQPGDTFLLCSDGLTGHVSNTEIGVIAHGLVPGDACHLLVNLANLRGGSDNITVVIAKVGDVPPGAKIEPEPPEPARSSSDTGMGWGWLAGFWATSAVFLAGIVRILLGNFEDGAVLVGGAIVATIVLAMKWSRARNHAGATDTEAGTPQCPVYTPANCKLTPQFLDQLAEVESALQRTAAEEGWEINWSDYEAAFTSAQESRAKKELSTALRGFSVAIDTLMQGMQLYRKQQKHQSKWGKTGRTGN